MVRRSSASNSTRASQRSNGANLGFEEKLWQAADRLRGHMDPSEYKHVVLGLIFLKYISDAFEERYQQLSQWTSDPSSDYYIKEPKERYQVLEDRDEYKAENVFCQRKHAGHIFKPMPSNLPSAS